MLQRLRAMRGAVDLWCIAEAFFVIVVTWLLLGWRFDAITQADGTWFVAPYTESALHAGVDWTEHAYRFGVIGGSEMHAFGGTTPLFQLCALLGLSTTATLNVTTLVLQLCYAVFGIWLATAIGGRRLTAPERVMAVWLCGFAPLLGWRLAIGHENLLQGLLPLLVTISLLWSARAKTTTITMLVFGAFAVAVGTTGMGAQTIAYSVVFGAPLVIATLVTAPRRWTAWHTCVAAAVVAGVLVMLPRISIMLAHVFGDDATRSFDASVVYSLGEARWLDWLGSLVWTTQAQDAVTHEGNFPIGPIVVLVVALWPISRRFGYAALASLAIALVFACNVEPLSTWFLDALPPLQAFRVPARAVMPILIFVPSFAIAGWLQRSVEPFDTRKLWVAVIGGALVILAVRERVSLVREPVAWVACAGIVILARRGDRRHALLLPIVAALSVCAFHERFPQGLPRDPIENGPRAMHTAVAPELASTLERIQLVDPPPPYDMSTALASRLPSIDGIWFPPRRFLELVGALQGAPLPATSVVFRFSRTRVFPVLQQLYNIKLAIVGLGTKESRFERLPPTNGAAWFPERVERVDDAQPMIAALRSSRDLRATLTATAWVRRGDGDVAGCKGRVLAVATDGRQTATLRTSTPSRCLLVVATNYVRALRATANGTSVPVLPVDIALTGIVVPAGEATIVLAPEVDIPVWSRIAQVIGVALLLFSVIWLVRVARAPDRRAPDRSHSDRDAPTPPAA